MPSVVDPTLDNIFEAMALWEQPALRTTSVPAASGLVAYVYFPTKAQFTAGLAYPYTVHGCDTTNYEKVSINNVPNAEVENIHTFWTGLIFGKDGDPWNQLMERDAKWRDAYQEQLVKHMQLIDPITLGPLRAQIVLKSAVPLSFDLFSRPEVGVKFAIEVWARRTLATSA